MATARPGANVGGISGSVWGVTFRSSRATMAVGTVPHRVRRPSASQLEYRELMAALGRHWRGLSDANRAAWQAWADAFGADLDPIPPRGANGWTRFAQWSTVADFCGLDPLDSPTNEGVGPAEFASLDLWANVEDETLEVSMLEPFLGVDASPTRIVFGLGPPRPHSRKRDPRQFGPVGFFDPDSVLPEWDTNPISIALDLGGIPRPWFWGYSLTIGGDGNVSSRGIWPLETAPPGQTWAFRMRPIADFIEMQSVERTPDDMLTFRGTVGGVPFEDPHDLTAPANATIADLIDTIDTISPWRTRQVNSSILTRPSTDIPIIPRRGKTVTTQPTLITVSE